MLRICDNSCVLPLKLIFRRVLQTGKYPTVWKQANITPAFKKNNKQLLNNYRPISLLSLCGKIFEKIVFEQLYSYLNSNDLNTRNQSGFRSDGLLFKLKKNDIHGSLLRFFESYLQNRQQRVVLDGFCSEYTEVKA